MCSIALTWRIPRARLVRRNPTAAADAEQHAPGHSDFNGSFARPPQRDGTSPSPLSLANYAVRDAYLHRVVANL
jgi:hypothetical protein